MSVFKSASTIATFTLLSRILGFVRDIFIASLLGTSAIADAFFVAFRLPNFFRTLFAEGAFSAAFVPTFSGILTKQGRAEAIQFAEKMFALMLWVLLLFTIIMQVAMPFVMLGLAPGFVGNPEQFDLAVYLTRVTFPYLFFISLVSIFGGVLNSLGKFAAAAATPIFLNLTLITLPFLLNEYTDTPAHALSWSIAVAGVIQFIWLYANCVKQGIWIKPRLPKLSPEVKKALRLMGPGVIASGVVQINLWVSTLIATLVPGTVATLYYADRVGQLPIAMIGVALGTAILPLLSRQLREGKTKDANKTLNHALFLALFFTLPAAIGILSIAEPIMITLFMRGSFTLQDALNSAQPLMVYGLGLPAFVLIKVLIPGFFAAENTKTPVKVASFSILINLPLTWWFVHLFPQLGLHAAAGIASASCLSAWVNASILFILLRQRKTITLFNSTTRKMLLSLLCAIIMGAAISYLGTLFHDIAPALRIPALVGLLGLAGLIYFGLGLTLRIVHLKDLAIWKKTTPKSS